MLEAARVRGCCCNCHISPSLLSVSHSSRFLGVHASLIYVPIILTSFLSVLKNAFFSVIVIIIKAISAITSSLAACTSPEMWSSMKIVFLLLLQHHHRNLLMLLLPLFFLLSFQHLLTLNLHHHILFQHLLPCHILIQMCLFQIPTLHHRLPAFILCAQGPSIILYNRGSSWMALYLGHCWPRLTQL